LRLKREPQFEEFEGDEAAAFAFAISKNIHRRHLKAKDKREAIAALLKIDPNKSDRQIAELTKTSPTFVGKTRKEEEATGDVSTVDTRTDSKGRKQPARKARSKPKRTVEDVAAKKAAAAPKPSPTDTAASEATAPDELDLLREFARFVIGRARVSTDPKDHPEWKVLLGRVKQALEVS
jgi:hypothetical protein